MWYERYFRSGNVFQLHEDDKELRDYIETLIEQGINFQKVFFTTLCGEEYVAVTT